MSLGKVDCMSTIGAQPGLWNTISRPSSENSMGLAGGFSLVVNVRILPRYAQDPARVYYDRVIPTLPRLAPRPHDPTITADLTVPASWRGWGWPETIVVRWEPEDAPGVSVKLEGRMTEDGPVMTSVFITGDDIRPDHLRMKFNTILRNAFAAAALGPRERGGYSRKAGVVLKVPVGPGRPIDITSARQRLAEIAAIHRNTPRGSKIKTVADKFGITEGYARKLVHEARQQGLI